MGVQGWLGGYFDCGELQLFSWSVDSVHDLSRVGKHVFSEKGGDQSLANPRCREIKCNIKRSLRQIPCNSNRPEVRQTL